VAVNKDAPTMAVSIATTQPRTIRPRLLSKRGRGLPQTAPEPPSISPSSRWVRPVSWCLRRCVLLLASITPDAGYARLRMHRAQDVPRASKIRKPQSTLPRHLHQPQVELEKRPPRFEHSDVSAQEATAHRGRGASLRAPEAMGGTCQCANQLKISAPQLKLD
jgi:hypothetical protein